jgi:hypothetical protein
MRLLKLYNATSWELETRTRHSGQALIEAAVFVIWARKTSNNAVLSRVSEPDCSTELKTYLAKTDLDPKHAIMRVINLRRGS